MSEGVLTALQMVEREALTSRGADGTRSVLVLISALRRYREASRILSKGDFSGCDCAMAVDSFLDAANDIEANPDDPDKYIPPWEASP